MLFSYLAMDLYDKHAKCAYPQAEKHPIFMLEHKHTFKSSGSTFHPGGRQAPIIAFSQ